MARVRSLRFRPLDIELHEPFGIAGGAQDVARNVLVEVELDDGTLGLGEAAPFPAVSGETQALVLSTLTQVAKRIADVETEELILGQAEAQMLCAEVPSALAGVEIALRDALARSSGQSLLSYYGGRQTTLSSDITIPTGDPDHAEAAARRALRLGFTQLKMKVGGSLAEWDSQRIQRVFSAHPRAQLIVDANASLSQEGAVRLFESCGKAREAWVAFEQPVSPPDLAGMRWVEERTGVAVLCDESLRSQVDLERILSMGKISGINLKIQKLGLLQTERILDQAIAAGLKIMIGGMVEADVSMLTSACLAAGRGGVEFVDLDTPWFLGPRPLNGGYPAAGPHLDLRGIHLGHGVSQRHDLALGAQDS